MIQLKQQVLSVLGGALIQVTRARPRATEQMGSCLVYGSPLNYATIVANAPGSLSHLIHLTTSPPPLHKQPAVLKKVES